MGTDIHLYVERRDPETGKWSLVTPPAPPPESERTETRKDRDGKEYQYVSPFWGPHQCMYISGDYADDADTEEDRQCNAMRAMRWYHNRNYSAFAILTGTVRNGIGFAGCDLGDGFHGIVSEPRGMPDGIGDWAKYASWDHNVGWLSLDEILAYNWDQVTRKRGVIPLLPRDDPWDKASYKEWRTSRGRPESYSGDVGGGGVRVVSESEAERLLGEPGQDKTYVRVQWKETYREAAGDFLAFVDQMLKPLGDPQHIRIVFGFDS